MGRDAHKTALPASRLRVRRWARRLLLAGVALVVLAAVCCGLLLTPAAGLVIRPYLARQLGVQVVGGTLRMDLGGDVLIEGVTLRTPEGPGKPVGQAARFLTIEKGRIYLWWRAYAQGQPLVRRVEVFQAQVRLTKPLDDFDLNVLAIEPPASANRGGRPLPGVLVHRASVLLGEHDDRGRITELRTLPMVFSLRPSRSQSGSYEVTAFEDPSLSTSNKPLRFEGRIGPEGFSGRLGGIDMADFPPSTIPAQLREAYAQLRIGGKTRGATVRYDRASDVLELVLDFQSQATGPAPLPDDSGIDARLDLRLPVPTDERGTLRPMIPASGSGVLRLVQRPDPARGPVIPWQQVQAPDEPGEPGNGRRTLVVQGRLRGTIEDASVGIDMTLWLGGAQPLYRFQVATLEPYRFSPATAWLSHPVPIVSKIAGLAGMLQASGSVSLWATVSQVADGQGVAQRVSGTGTLRQGAIRFEHFPYPVQNITGAIELDDGQIRLPQMIGWTPSGSQVLASVEVALDEVATGVLVEAQAFAVPYDDTLAQTLDAVSPAIRDIVLDERAYRRLVEQGLVRPAGSPGWVPAFALGGEIDATLRVHRQAGVQGSTTVRVEARSPRFGLLPGAFALPMVAQDLRLLVELPSEVQTTAQGKDRQLLVRATGAKATTLAGGLATIDLLVAVPLDQDDTPAPKRSTTVQLDVQAQDVPIHPALLAALPEASPGRASGLGGLDGVLARLGPSGPLDASVRVTRDQRGSLDWWAQVQPAGLTLQPPALDARPPLRIEGVTGTIRVDGRSVQGELQGRSDRAGVLHAQVRADRQDASLIATVAAEGMDLRTPIEDAIAAFDASLARTIGQARRTYAPEGRADLSASIRLDGQHQPAAGVRLFGLDGVRFDWLGGRMGMDQARGAIALTTTDAGPLLVFDRLSAQGVYDQSPIGRIRVRGRLPLDALGSDGARFDRDTTLRIEVLGGSLDSPLLRTLAGSRAGQELAGMLESLDLRGEYDAMVALDVPAYAGTGPGSRPVRRFELSPYDASFVRHGRRIEVPWISGLITGTQTTPSTRGLAGPAGYAGRIDNLTLGGDDWWASLDGAWQTDGTTFLHAEGDLDGVVQADPLNASADRRRGLPAALLAILPQGVDEALEAMALHNEDAVHIRGGSVRVDLHHRRPARVQAQATVDLASIRAGQRASSRAPDDPGPQADEAPPPIARLSDATLQVHADTADRALVAELQLDARRGMVWGLPLGPASLRAEVGRQGRIVLPTIQASAGGGRVAGRGRIVLPGEAGGSAGYELDLAGAGLHTEAVIAAIQDRPPAEGHALGEMDLALGLAGVVGSPEVRRGRGSLRIRGGSPVDLPMAIRAAVEALNVRLGADRYDAVNGDFYVSGRSLTFTRLQVGSDAVVLEGLGTVDLDDASLDLTITSRPRQDNWLRALVRAWRDAIVSVQVRGTLDDPEPAPRPQALVGPLDRLRRMIQGGLTYEEWQRERLRRYARQRSEPRSGW
ncbi:MAG: hypothetical protein KatS3mg103_1293 [Phycisphaerales bacterium]|nr:MAG: hypothetical protein KatS3mg103_1293 [Phycisphaerales bacterium]